ncbi:FtsX-like permease family protein [Pseudoflavitalea sp. G-6-1-2]|uniref:ABC transporter permease n=1 Tax=Pseudoflavitalea sp. G-6-1-2 TaxID=2728841 RepID=UPI00146BAE3E|nr:ABC transporter permease [Pseudoflavitalea sp. G-6-1-2]NML23664.1 FtsX-like permease family protein [Pseudoflavitalea sp. G-6-1-2]
MLKSYFLIAIRNLKRNKVFSVINIAGLALGLTCSLLVMLWVLDERSVDQFHANKDRLYSVYQRQYSDGKTTGGHYTPGMLAQELKKLFPEVEASTGLAWNDWLTFQVGDKIVQMEGNHADSDFFKMFSYPLLEGKPQSALSDPSGMAVSRHFAETFFGSPQAAIGKTVRVENRDNLVITAVFENMPKNSTQKWDYLFNWHYLQQYNDWVKQWANNGPATMLLLRSDANVAQFEARIKNYMDRHLGNEGWHVELYLQKYADRYLWSNMKDGFIAGGRIEYVRLFSIVAVFILLIACINFMNLTTARSIKRSKEIGVRKVSGAIRPALIRQFIGEAIVVVAIAMTAALILLFIALPFFNQLTQKEIELPFSQWAFWGSIFALTMLTGLLAGSYPALFLSSFKPVVVLKGVMKASASANRFRKGLVVFQFALSSLLIIGTIIVARQVQYIQNKNLGFNRENIVRVLLQGELPKHYETFRQKITAIPGVTSITPADQDPMQIANSTTDVEWEGKTPNTKPIFSSLGVGYDLIKTMQMQLVEGRDFSRDYGNDSAAFILNETAVKKIGYKDPIGKTFTLWETKGTIIGVVKDFHYGSMHNAIEPLVIHLSDNSKHAFALVRIEGARTKEAVAAMEQINNQLNPKFPFTYSFSDERFRQLYASETLINKLSNCFAVLAILISSLGLLGLAMFAAEQRVREIGIRKVLGADIKTLFVLLSREFLMLVFIAFIIACPVAWWAMNNWLHNYEYRTTINAWPFVIAGLAALAIALFTISFQTVKAALANPIKSLRSE